MIWIGISIVFWFLVIRELLNQRLTFAEFDGFDWGYLVTLIIIASLTAWMPFSHWRFEQQLSRFASKLADNKPANVHCNTAFDAIFDNDLNVAGHANPETGEIVMQYTWCAKLINYIDNPQKATDQEIWSMSVFVHEAMHARGEYNEAKTECQAIQRRHRAERMFGISDLVARKNSNYYYRVLYPQHPYFSADCAKGKAMDERLRGSGWRFD
jgi:hypothetical protein